MDEAVAAKIDALDRVLTSEIDGLRRETEQANTAAAKAVELYKEEARERLAAHNGLIDQMRQQALAYVSREVHDQQIQTIEDRLNSLDRFQARLLGGLILVGFLGVANIVEILVG